MQGENTLCTIIKADYTNETVEIQNYTDIIEYRAFGVKTNPTWKDYEIFIKDRVFPETRAEMKRTLRSYGLDFYDPLLIIDKTSGRMADDTQWLIRLQEQKVINLNTVARGIGSRKIIQVMKLQQKLL